MAVVRERDISASPLSAYSLFPFFPLLTQSSLITMSNLPPPPPSAHSLTIISPLSSYSLCAIHVSFLLNITSKQTPLHWVITFVSCIFQNDGTLQELFASSQLPSSHTPHHLSLAPPERLLASPLRLPPACKLPKLPTAPWQQSQSQHIIGLNFSVQFLSATLRTALSFLQCSKTQDAQQENKVRDYYDGIIVLNRLSINNVAAFRDRIRSISFS